MSARCPDCDLPRWDADDLTAGDMVCGCHPEDWDGLYDAVPPLYDSAPGRNKLVITPQSPVGAS